MREIKFKLGGQGWKPKIIRRLGKVLMEYQHRLSRGQEDPGLYKSDPFEIKLKEEAKTPIVSRSYRYNPVVAKEVDSIIVKYLKAGIIRRSQSPYAAPIVVVLKKNGKIRITCDYRRLNEATVIPQTPIPRIDELLDTLESASFFSSFDMMLGFHQIMIGENSVPLTAFCTTSGLYEFLMMPTCPVMTIFRRADEPRSRRRSRGQDEEGRQYIEASASSRTSQDEDQDHCSGGLILILMIPTLGP